MATPKIPAPPQVRVTSGWGVLGLIMLWLGWALSALLFYLAYWAGLTAAGMAKDSRWWPTLGAFMALASAIYSPWMAIPWLVLALGISELVRRGKSVWLSEHEWGMAKWWDEALAVWIVAYSFVPLPVSLVALLLITVMWTVPWADGRRTRYEESKTAPKHFSEAGPTVAPWKPKKPDFTRIWNEKIATETAGLECLQGRWLKWDPDTDSGVIRLHDYLATDATGLTTQIERVMNWVHGTIRLEHRPEDRAKDLRVTYVKNVIGTTKEIQYWTGPSLSAKGGMLLGTSLNHAEARLPLSRPGGAAHGMISGGTGSGKGGLQRTIIIEAGMADWVYVIAVDGKGGTGFPEIKQAADLFVDDSDSIDAAIESVVRIMQARQRRYGAQGYSAWAPNLDPLIMLCIDEMHEVSRGLSKKATAGIDTLAAQARAAGIGLWLASQRAEVGSFGGPRVRANLLAGGTGLVGRAGDQRSGDLARQAWDIDLGAMPRVAGWFYQLTQVDDTPPVMVRTLYIPSEQDRVNGMAAPHGTAEQWAERATHIQLHPEDQAILDERFEGDDDRDEPVATVHPIRGDVPRSENQPPKRGETEQAILDTMTAEPNRRWMASELADKVGKSKRWLNTVLDRKSVV